MIIKKAKITLSTVISVCLVTGLSLLFSEKTLAMDKCNYTFVYFYNDKKGPIDYRITTNTSDNSIGPDTSGTLQAGESKKFWFGSSSGSKTIQPGGLFTLSDDAGTIATVDYEVTWGGNEWACLLNLSMTIESGYKGNAGSEQQPPSECITNFANANYNGDTNNDKGSDYPAVNFKICD